MFSKRLQRVDEDGIAIDDDEYDEDGVDDFIRGGGVHQR
jgi:hypothetical protein